MADPEILLPRVDGCDLPAMEQCEACGDGPMLPEHAHSRCAACGHIRPCCGW